MEGSAGQKAPELKKKGLVKEALHSPGDIFVIKVGTSSLVRPEQQTLNLTNLARISETVKLLKSEGHHVIIVTSGAVGVGCQRLGLTTRPSLLAKKQALAAVGQVHLMKFYEDFFAALGL
ncbi:Glutamate 5-kinase, partial [Tetrabaena socialis]